jgi:hypothetical protein
MAPSLRRPAVGARYSVLGGTSVAARRPSACRHVGRDGIPRRVGNPPTAANPWTVAISARAGRRIRARPDCRAAPARQKAPGPMRWVTGKGHPPRQRTLPSRDVGGMSALGRGVQIGQADKLRSILCVERNHPPVGRSQAHPNRNRFAAAKPPNRRARCAVGKGIAPGAGAGAIVERFHSARSLRDNSESPLTPAVIAP